jgi:cobalt/nickel transport system permease protein
MDPRVKILGLLSFSLVIAVSGDFTVLIIAVAASVSALLLARLNMRQVAIRLAAVNGFVLFLWLFLPFTTPGEVVTSWGWLDVHREGVLLSLSITLKANSIAVATIALLGTSSIFDLVHALVHLKVSNQLIQLFFFCYRYISVIHNEYTRLRASMRIRCFKPRMCMHNYRSIAYLVGMLFVRSNDRSERIYQAMLLRGFTGTFWTLDHFHMHRSDWVAAGAMAVLVLFLIGLQIQ